VSAVIGGGAGIELAAAAGAFLFAPGGGPDADDDADCALTATVISTRANNDSVRILMTILQD
jgi:hypothetical protein